MGGHIGAFQREMTCRQCSVGAIADGGRREKERKAFETALVLVAMRKCPPAATTEPVYGQELVAASGQGAPLTSAGRSRLHRRSNHCAICPCETAISVDLQLTQTSHPLPLLISKHEDGYLRALVALARPGMDPSYQRKSGVARRPLLEGYPRGKWPVRLGHQRAPFVAISLVCPEMLLAVSGHFVMAADTLVPDHSIAPLFIQWTDSVKTDSRCPEVACVGSCFQSTSRTRMTSAY